MASSSRTTARRVLAPDGRQWKVTRGVLPWRPRWRGKRRRGGSDDWLDLIFWTDLDEWPGLGVVLAVATAVVLLVLFVIPAVILLVEVAVLVFVLAGAVVLSTLLGRPWVVEARTAGPPEEVRRWKVRGGWRRSQRVVADIAAALQAGAHPPQGPDIHPVAGRDS